MFVKPLRLLSAKWARWLNPLSINSSRCWQTVARTLVIQGIRALSDVGCADNRVRTALVDLWQSNSQSPKTKAQVAIALCKLKIEAKGLLRLLSSTLVTSPDVPP